MVISPLNYTGNKAKALREIKGLFPCKVNLFVDAFCGSGIVSFNSEANEIICNDANEHIVNLLKYLYDNDAETVISEMEKIICKYGFTDSTNKNNVYIEHKHEGLSRYNKAPFERLKADYNNNPKIELLFALVIYGFNHYLRFNSKDQYNVPVGKVDFSESLRRKTREFCCEIKKYPCTFSVTDFRNPLLYEKCDKDSLIYFDPPYLVTTAPYNSSWTQKDDDDLFELFDKLAAKGLRVALSNVFSSNTKINTRLIEWSKKYTVHHLQRQYRNANYQKINKADSDEVLITNF